MTDEQRHQALQRYVTEATRQGWRVTSSTNDTAQLAKGKPTNHILHLILTVLTLGFWAVVWIAVAVFGGEQHRYVSVSDQGQVVTS